MITIVWLKNFSANNIVDGSCGRLVVCRLLHYQRLYESDIWLTWTVQTNTFASGLRKPSGKRKRRHIAQSHAFLEAFLWCMGDDLCPYGKGLPLIPQIAWALLEAIWSILVP